MTDAKVNPVVGNVRALQPARVALAARDKRFLKVASFLLARRGYRVSQAPTDAELMRLADKQPFDVVVLDASTSLSSSLRTAAALSAVHPNVHILLATEHSAVAADTTYQQFDKWRDLGALPDEVARAQLGLGVDSSPAQAS